MKRTPPFSLLIKPASASCNLRCKYCFYIEHLQYIKKGDSPAMTSETLEKLISTYLSLSMNEYTFAWQGGEPTILGLDFFKKVVELQHTYAPRGAVVTNTIQTNGTLITKPLAEFFAEHNFLIGVSLDGPKPLHDTYRLTASGGPTHSMVMKGISILRTAHAEFNILCLVNAENIKNPRTLYKYFHEKNFRFLQFIPCVEFLPDGRLTSYSITGKQWGEFLCKIFDLWYRKDTKKVSIRHFDAVLNYLVFGRYTQCTMAADCRQYLVVEYDGGIFPCDFFVKKELQLGNIHTSSWEDILHSSLYRAFGERKSRWNIQCSTCEWLPLCHGDCQKMRGPHARPDTLSVLCEGWQMFYRYTAERFKILADSIRQDMNS